MDQEIILPEIFCPFPARFEIFPNQYAGTVEKILAADPLGLADPKVVDYTGRLYADATPAGLEMASWLLLMFFSNDGWSEERETGGDVHTPGYLDTVYQAAMRSLAGEPAATDMPDFVKMMHPLGRLVREVTGPATTVRFTREMHRCFQAQAWELDYLRQGAAAAAQSYTDLRRLSSTVMTIFELHPSLFGVTVPEHVLDHPVVWHLRMLLTDCFGFSNDLLSLNKELREGSFTNLVLVLQKESGGSLQEAADAAGARMRSLVLAYLDLKARLPRLSVGTPGEVEAVIALLECEERLLADSLGWHRSARYERHGAT